MNTFLFDLDGTLLPLREDEFIEIYMTGLLKKMITAGMSKEKFAQALWGGIDVMRKNTGKMTNESVFWGTFGKILDIDYKPIEALFLEYYINDFSEIKKATTYTPLAAECINTLKDKGYQMILATNPLFPKVATYQRIKWAGLKPEDFLFVTTIENSYYSKPNLNYYQDILDKFHLKPQDCIMVGNDVEEDMIASKLGIDVFLVKDCLVNRLNKDSSIYKQGKLEDLLEFIVRLPKL